MAFPAADSLTSVRPYLVEKLPYAVDELHEDGRPFTVAVLVLAMADALKCAGPKTQL